MRRLDEEQRHFFDLVGQAVVTNPFSSARSDLDRQIAGRYPQSSSGNLVNEAVAEVVRRIDLLSERRQADINAFDPPDRMLLQHAFLFEVFHCFIPQFDTLIADQVAAGERSLPVPFAPKFVARLERYGFSHQEALRYFELCFQLRRAFFFSRRYELTSPCW